MNNASRLNLLRRHGSARFYKVFSLLFIALSLTAAFWIYNYRAQPGEQAHFNENQLRLFSHHFVDLGIVLDRYIAEGLSEQESRYIVENWSDDDRELTDIVFVSSLQFAYDVAELQQRDFYRSLLENDGARVREEATKLKQYVEEGSSFWSGPYGVNVEVEYGLHTKDGYRAILRYGKERISPLFEMDPAISYNFRRYNSDRTAALRKYYIGHGAIWLLVSVGIYLVLTLISVGLKKAD